MNDKNILWYCTRHCAAKEIASGKVLALKLDDANTYYVGLELRPDSEYMDVFNHYILKGKENGIIYDC